MHWFYDCLPYLYIHVTTTPVGHFLHPTKPPHTLPFCWQIPEAFSAELAFTPRCPDIRAWLLDLCTALPS